METEDSRALNDRNDDTTWVYAGRLSGRGDHSRGYKKRAKYRSSPLKYSLTIKSLVEVLVAISFKCSCRSCVGL
jgi:hypothetical protein